MTNSIKTLVAAAVVAVAGSAAFAGPNYIIPGQAQSLTSTVNLDLVRADANVPYQAVARGGVLLQQANAKRIGFVTDPDSER